MVNIEYIRG